jgi:hypothetical protein
MVLWDGTRRAALAVDQVPFVICDERVPWNTMVTVRTLAEEPV